MRKNALNEVWKMALNTTGSPQKMSQDYFSFLPQEQRTIVSETETVVLERNYPQKPNRADFAGKTDTCRDTQKDFFHMLKR